MAETDFDFSADLDNEEVEYTSLLFFKDKDNERAYEKFNNTVKLKLASSGVIVVLGCTSQLIHGFFTLYSRHSNLMFQLIFPLLVLCAVLCMISIYYKTNVFTTHKSVDAKIPVNINAIENCYILGTAVYTSIRLLTRFTVGPCSGLEFMEVLGCNPNHAVGGVPMDTLFGIALNPIMFAVIYRSASWSSTLISWLISIGSMIIVGVLSGATAKPYLVAIFTAYIPLSLSILFESRRQSISIFLTNKKLAGLIAENERMAEAIRKDELRSMIGNVAHDLKTPLAAFVNGSEMVTSVLNKLTNSINGGNIDKMVVEESIASIEAVMKNITNINCFMIMTINRCIDYTKASKGIRLVAKPSSLCLRETLELPYNCIKDLQQTNICVAPCEVDPMICSHIITDQQWLQENLLCLLSNALKYSDHGTIKVRLNINSYEELSSLHDLESVSSRRNSREESQKVDKFLLLEVEDTGIGISLELRRSLFCPFKQAQRLAGGTGLGLYSLAKRVEALQGYYGTTDRRDGEQGSLVWLAIPHTADEEMARGSLAAVSDDTATNKNNVKDPSKLMDILIVDDAVPVAKICGKMLSSLGHHVTTAHNGAVGVEKVTKKWKNHHQSSGNGTELVKPRFDLILMDLQMPVMDGLEATKRIRAFESESVREVNDKSHTLIIGFSANSDEETAQLALVAGVDDFIPKPFSMKNLEEKISKFTLK